MNRDERGTADERHGRDQKGEHSDEDRDGAPAASAGVGSGGPANGPTRGSAYSY
jgi:hypothetical protein